MEDIFEIEPILDPKDRKAQRRIIWALVGGFLLMNIGVVFMGMASAKFAANVESVSDIIFWFNVSAAGVIGSFFGVDIVSKFTTRQIVSMKRVS